jgi:hypothetical protein
MNTDALRTAYQQFVDAAREAGPVPARNGEWGTDLVLAHVIVGDRLIAQTAADVLAGRPGRFDNEISLCEPYLHAVAEAAGGWEGLLEAVSQGGRELIGLAERTSDEQAGTEVHLRIVSAGQVVVDAPATLGQLLQGPATAHLPLHQGQLAALTAASPGR